MEHSGARNRSLKDDMDATLNIFVSASGHANPKDVNLPMPHEQEASSSAQLHDVAMRISVKALAA
jgi:hypothetical protein